MSSSIDHSDRAVDSVVCFLEVALFQSTQVSQNQRERLPQSMEEGYFGELYHVRVPFDVFVVHEQIENAVQILQTLSQRHRLFIFIFFIFFQNGFIVDSLLLKRNKLK